jgi:hypothetical protein
MTGLENYVLAVVCPKFSAQMQKVMDGLGKTIK